MSPTFARIVFWVAALSCAAAHGLLIRSVLSDRAMGDYPDDRRRKSRRGGMRWGPDRRAPASEGEPSSPRELEIGWAVLPALGLTALLIATWFALPD